ncbi:MAG: hypothetical protein ABI723_14430, partial [Bacteroidia bacterium]
MKRKYFFIVIFFLFYNNLFGQGRDNYWPLGYHSFTSFPDVGGLTVDFSNNVFNFYDHPREMWMQFTNASICDDIGNLLFYTNGVYIANAQDDTMLNGSGINPSFYTTSFYQGGLRLPQANIILPKPGNDSLYYLFHETKDITFGSSNTRGIYLYSSTINMNGDSSRGEVINKNNILLTDTLFVGALTACKHANGRDWWLLVPEYGSNLGYYTLLITPDTIQEFSHNYYPIDGSEGGQACFSPDGSKYILTYWWGAAFFDFDRCTGTLNLIDTISKGNAIYCLGASVSPNSQYCYITLDGLYILQFNLQASNIPASVDTVAVWDGYPVGGIPAAFWLHQIGPDGKIYISTGNTTWTYHKIDDPDSAGIACDMQQHPIIFPHANNSIPNFPNYNLGRLIGSPCDTLQWAGVTEEEQWKFRFSVLPNPNAGNFKISYLLPQNKNGLFQIIDVTGKTVYKQNLPQWSTLQN